MHHGQFKGTDQMAARAVRHGAHDKIDAARQITHIELLLQDPYGLFTEVSVKDGSAFQTKRPHWLIPSPPWPTLFTFSMAPGPAAPLH